MNHFKFKYSLPRQIHEDLWEVRGEWSNKLGRRMTVIRINSNELLIHSAIAIKDADLNWLNSLGKVSYIVAPNTFHCSDAPWYAQKFPDAQLFVPESKLIHFSKLGLNPKNLNIENFKSVSDEVEFFYMRGSRMQETALIHKKSKTLILCDLAFNMENVFSGIEKRIMNWNKVGGQFGPSKLTKYLFTKSTKELKNSYSKIMDMNFDRIIVNHGQVLETGGKLALQLSVSEIFGEI